MKKIILIECSYSKTQNNAQKLEKELSKGSCVQLLRPNCENEFIKNQEIEDKASLLISSGGTSGGPHLCLHPIEHLNESAKATQIWLKEQNIEPKDCLIFNPLPFYHVSGLMPYWRSLQWGTEHFWIAPDLIKNPINLNIYLRSLLQNKDKFLLISLVPIQLNRLLSKDAGINALKLFNVIWVGGSSISKESLSKARSLGIRLSPCYGSTETASMVTSLKPEHFLQGVEGCGEILNKVEIDIGLNNVIRIRTPRIATKCWKRGRSFSLINNEGWWESADIGFIDNERERYIHILGRVDNAIHIGGETVFPEELENKFKKECQEIGILVKNVLFLPLNDQEWENRIIAILNLENKFSNSNLKKTLLIISRLVENWPKHQRPVKLYINDNIKSESIGKINRKKWIEWAKDINKSID